MDRKLRCKLAAFGIGIILPLFTFGQGFHEQTIISRVELSLPEPSKRYYGSDYLSLGLSVLGGIINGSHEAYEADRRIFEKRWGVGEESWWGSKSWKRKYKDYDNGDERPTFWQSKDLLVGFTDYDHFGEDARFVFNGGAVFILGFNGAKRKYKWWEHAMRLGINLTAYVAASSITYNSLRY